MTDCSARGSWTITIDDIMSSIDDDDVVSFRKPWGEDATVQLAYHDISDTFSIIVNKVPLTPEGEYFLSLQGRQLKSILMYSWRSRKELRLETDDDYLYIRSVYPIGPIFFHEKSNNKSFVVFNVLYATQHYRALIADLKSWLRFCTEADLKLFVKYVNRCHLVSKWYAKLTFDTVICQV